MTHPAWAEADRCGISLHNFPDSGPEVAILIPTRNRAGLLKNCVQSLRSTTYRNFRVVIADNSSDDPETLSYLAKVHARVLRIGDHGAGVSDCCLNNRAVEQIDAPYVLFLHNDTQVLEPRWLSRMMGFRRWPAWERWARGSCCPIIACSTREYCNCTERIAGCPAMPSSSCPTGIKVISLMPW